jgi:hypothetical protein
MADHVHRIAPMGARVLINGTWYYTTVSGDVTCIGAHFGIATKALVKNERGTSQAQSKEHARFIFSLDLARATVRGTLWLSDEDTKFLDGVDLTGARIGRIVDTVTKQTSRRKLNPSSVSPGNSPSFLLLDGLTYDRFGEDTDVSAAARIAFLRLQQEDDLGKNFKPQPWMQMVKVLRESGHTEAARDVAIAYEDERRKARVVKSKTARALHWAYGLLVRYGHRPMRLVKITVAVWLAFGIFYHIAAVVGVFAPSNPLVFQNSAYAQCSPNYDRFDELMPEKIGNWYWCDRLPDEYTTFNPYLYSLDLILPLVDLQQDKDWAPMIPTPGQHFMDFFSLSGWHLNHVVRLAVWAEILFGWVASLLFVSVAANFIKRMDTE